MWRVAAGMLLLGLSLPVLAESQIESDVQALVKKASAHIKKNGLDVACKDFANPSGGFIQGELYVYVQDMHAKMICHSTNPKLNGKDLIDLKDPEGKSFNKEMIEVLSTKDSGWVHYKFFNPASKRIDPKASYVERQGDFMVGAGYYIK